MAVSKNNRKSGKKRTKNHCAPPSPVREAQVKAQNEEELAKDKKHFRISMIALVVMCAGLALIWMKLELPGYAVALVGGVLGIYASKYQKKGQKVTFICYTIYTVMMMVILIGRIRMLYFNG